MARPRLTLDSTFLCSPLRCSLTVRCCLVRQVVARRQMTRDTWRGQGGTFPSCRRCAQGARLLASVPGAGAVTWRGAGNGGFRLPEREARAAQRAARARLAAVGLLDFLPTIDQGPGLRDDVEAPEPLTRDDLAVTHQG